MLVSCLLLLEGLTDTLFEHHFLFCCILNSPLARIQTAEAAAQQKQEVMLTKLSFSIKRVAQTTESRFWHFQHPYWVFLTSSPQHTNSFPFQEICTAAPSNQGKLLTSLYPWGMTTNWIIGRWNLVCDILKPLYKRDVLVPFPSPSWGPRPWSSSWFAWRCPPWRCGARGRASGRRGGRTWPRPDSTGRSSRRNRCRSHRDSAICMRGFV